MGGRLTVNRVCMLFVMISPSTIVRRRRSSRRRGYRMCWCFRRWEWERASLELLWWQERWNLVWYLGICTAQLMLSEC